MGLVTRVLVFGVLVAGTKHADAFPSRARQDWDLGLGPFGQNSPDLPDGLSSPLLLPGQSGVGERPNAEAYPVPEFERPNNDADDENEKEDEETVDSTTKATSTTRLGFQNTMQRVRDYGGGVLGIVSSAATLNLRGILHGSTQFIPPHIRVGVEDILGAIIGSPLDPNRFLVTYPTAATNLSKIIDTTYEKIVSNRTGAATPAPPRVDPNRIPVAETEATPTSTAKTIIIPVPVESSPESVVVVYETTVQPTEPSTAATAAQDVDDKDDNDLTVDESEEEDDGNDRSLLDEIKKLNTWKSDIMNIYLRN